MKFSFEHAWAGGRSQASGVFMTALPRNTLAHAGIPQPKRKEHQLADPLFPKTGNLPKLFHALAERPTRMLR